jgi:hypothetical protein
MAFEIASRTTFRTVMRSRLMSLMSGVELTSEQRATMTVMAQLARLRSFFVSALEGEACSARLVQQTRFRRVNEAVLSGASSTHRKEAGKGRGTMDQVLLQTKERSIELITHAVLQLMYDPRSSVRFCMRSDE